MAKAVLFVFSYHLYNRYPDPFYPVKGNETFMLGKIGLNITIRASVLRI